MVTCSGLIMLTTQAVLTGDLVEVVWSEEEQSEVSGVLEEVEEVGEVL